MEGEFFAALQISPLSDRFLGDLCAATLVLMPPTRPVSPLHSSAAENHYPCIVASYFVS